MADSQRCRVPRSGGARGLQIAAVAVAVASVGVVHLGGRVEGYLALALVCGGWRWLDERTDRRRMRGLVADRVEAELRDRDLHVRIPSSRARGEGEIRVVALGGLVVGEGDAGDLERGPRVAVDAVEAGSGSTVDPVRLDPIGLAGSSGAASRPRRRANGRRPSLSGARRR